MSEPPTTGLPWLDNLLLWTTFIIVLGGSWAVFIRNIRPLFAKLSDFFDDWNGRPARPGHAAEPGVMERLATVEYQVHNNGGNSMKDSVDWTKTALQTHLENCDTITSLAETMQLVARSTPGEEAQS